MPQGITSLRLAATSLLKHLLIYVIINELKRIKMILLFNEQPSFETIDSAIGELEMMKMEIEQHITKCRRKKNTKIYVVQRKTQFKNFQKFWSCWMNSPRTRRLYMILWS